MGKHESYCFSKGEDQQLESIDTPACSLVLLVPSIFRFEIRSARVGRDMLTWFYEWIFFLMKGALLVPRDKHSRMASPSPFCYFIRHPRQTLREVT